jgi:hypothetical protein
MCSPVADTPKKAEKDRAGNEPARVAVVDARVSCRLL